MTRTNKAAYITPVGGNVFADLGFSPKEAAALKSKSKKIISEKLAIDSLVDMLARTGKHVELSVR